MYMKKGWLIKQGSSEKVSKLHCEGYLYFKHVPSMKTNFR